MSDEPGTRMGHTMRALNHKMGPRDIKYSRANEADAIVRVSHQMTGMYKICICPLTLI